VLLYVAVKVAMAYAFVVGAMFPATYQKDDAWKVKPYELI